MSDRLAIFSVHGAGAVGIPWLDLQTDWIRRTTSDFCFGIVENGVSFHDLPEGVISIARSQFDEGHAAGLRLGIEWFRCLDASHLLILDSDAFPLRSGWFSHLVHQLRRFGKRFAAPIRFENLDRFPHPCAMLIERSIIDEPWFSLQDGIKATNLLDDVIRDVAASMVDRHGDVLPLLRSNALNLHPVAAAIYGDCFYHHGAGSREFRFRSSDRYAYFDGWPIPVQDPVELQRRLFDDPVAFIELLRRGPASTGAS